MDFRDLVHRGQIVKICGLCETEHAVIAAGAGADLIGFIFAPTRRQVTAETARASIEAAKAANANVLAVGVFVDAEMEEMRAVIETAGLDLVQLNGARRAVAGESLPVPTLRALLPKPDANATAVIAKIDEDFASAEAPAAFIIDGYVAGASGGTGVRADWDLAQNVSALRPVMLAGGLDPHNVGDAIQRVAPLGVDVSSGVEVGGTKNSGLIEAFIREARAAFLALN